MSNNAETQPDLEKQEDVKADRTRRLLKWAIVLSVVALLAIVGVAIPMALKVLPEKSTTDTSSAAAANNDKEPTDGFGGETDETPVETVEPTIPPVRPTPAEPDAPTAEPSMATPVPTGRPTRSAEPTDDNPSSNPTFAPTTLAPTQNPTPLASAVPTLSMAPTVAPIDPNHAFKLRLFWQRGFYWQESFQEVWHCVECTKCKEYGAGDGVEHGCEEYPNGSSSFCQEGDMFWIMGCESGMGARFNVVENPGSGHQIRLDGTNLCMGRGAPDADTGEWKRRLMQAVKCNNADVNQLWAPFEKLSKFELRPMEHAGRTEEDAECVSQLHHPKNEEVISMHGCKLSRIYETRYWEEY
eukprot:CAMPEP_0113610632 /NCGR_PEP_ID=MMETSP0017_2-20120614/5129_1 /TAXON_ID=2856 /ORGANISM="Cylindrotheca closterium" /LENGTH=354 /DNA_ID=CAMNT_0000519531 /DNA_START=75 /DNA_END=1139 /DNA_ORIENTATION=- /assembly_acc=CAM_ASM_000147